MPSHRTKYDLHIKEYEAALQRAFGPERLRWEEPIRDDQASDRVVIHRHGPCFELRNAHGFHLETDVHGTITVAVFLTAECPEPPPVMAQACRETPDVDDEPLPHEASTFATITNHDRGLRELLTSLGFQLTDWPHHLPAIERNLGDDAFESWVLTESAWFLATDSLSQWVAVLESLMACRLPTRLG